MNRPKSRRPTKMSKAPARDEPTFDEILEDVHATRSKILARFDNDMDRYIEYLNSNPALDTPSPKLVRSKPTRKSA